jgi:hypothetical protein
MSFRLALLSGLLCLLTRVLADVPVYFDNRAFGTAGLVTLQYPFGIDKGGLRNEIPESDSAWIA